MEFKRSIEMRNTSSGMYDKVEYDEDDELYGFDMDDESVEDHFIIGCAIFSIREFVFIDYIETLFCFISRTISINDLTISYDPTQGFGERDMERLNMLDKFRSNLVAGAGIDGERCQLYCFFV